MINTKTNIILRSIIVPVILIFLYSCDSSENLTFQKRTITINDFVDCEHTDCILTEIVLLESISDTEISRNINREIEKTAAAALHIEEDSSVEIIGEAIQSFQTSYQELKKEFPEEIIPYEASIHCEMSFQNVKILSILIDSYIFTGGAHGSGNSIYLNLDTKTGKVIDNKRMFKDYLKFSDFAEKIFRKEQDISERASINSTGFFFEDNIFILPENIGLTDTHVILLYNQYEISSYADGPVEIRINKKEIADYLAIDIL